MSPKLLLHESISWQDLHCGVELEFIQIFCEVYCVKA
jgi:hypothetical protein